MIPVDQIRVSAPMGQCTEAAIASLLHVQLGDVPDLYDPARPDDRSETWPALLRWINAQGYLWIGGPLGGDRPLPLLLPMDLPYVAERANLGWKLRRWWRGHHLLLGYNPAGVGHACVGLAGALVHDPNPSRAGLATVDEVAVLVPVADMTWWPELVAQGSGCWSLP